jgi:hypothetical protein
LSSGFRAIVAEECTSYAINSCPAGYWGDATTSRCVPCDENVGRVGNGVTGKITEAEACTNAAFLIDHVGASVEYSANSPYCFTDGVGTYDRGEHAVMTVVIGGTLWVPEFNLYPFDVQPSATGNDYLVVKGKIYGNDAGPSGVVLSPGVELTWKSDIGGDYMSDDTTTDKMGFTVCMCDTSTNYRVFIPKISNTEPDACTEFTLNTCPGGTYGDAATMRCVPCDKASGMSSRGVPNQVTEDAACEQAAFTYSAAKMSYPSATCVKMPSYVESSPQHETITATTNGLLYTEGVFEINPGSGKDYFSIAGVRYADKNLLLRKRVTVGNVIDWTAGSTLVYDQYCTCGGYTLCSCPVDNGHFNVLEAGGGTDLVCTSYTHSTCPVGYWGDAQRGNCIPCDIAVGRTTKAGAVAGATTEAAACESALFSFVGNGIEYTSAQCITDGGGPYSANEVAVITPTVAGVLFTEGNIATASSTLD